MGLCCVGPCFCFCSLPLRSPARHWHVWLVEGRAAGPRGPRTCASLGPRGPPPCAGSPRGPQPCAFLGPRGPRPCVWGPRGPQTGASGPGWGRRVGGPGPAREPSLGEGGDSSQGWGEKDINIFK